MAFFLLLALLQFFARYPGDFSQRQQRVGPVIQVSELALLGK
jgi:hypothetical protein